MADQHKSSEKGASEKGSGLSHGELVQKIRENHAMQVRKCKRLYQSDHVAFKDQG